MFDFGQNLYLKRLERGMTQRELVQKTGIPQPNLSRIERGRQDVTVSTFLNLCAALGVSPSEILAPFVEGKAPFLLTRNRIERIGRAVVHRTKLARPPEQEIADCLSRIIPECAGGPLTQKEVRRAWFHLRQRFGKSEIKILAERVRDALQRKR